MIRWVLRVLIRVYQLVLSPFIHSASTLGSLPGPPSSHGCRFTPTCSSYADEALRVWGPVRGTRLTFIRILSCHPFSKKPTFDPVPERE